MEKKPRLGSDPLGWITDTREGAEDSKQSKQSLQSKPKKEQGLKDGWTRAAFIMRKERLEKLRALAYWDRKQIKEVMDEALASYLKGKKIRPIEKKEER